VPDAFLKLAGDRKIILANDGENIEI